ncbi:MAG: T9SS type A sorting domain-containing protein [Bacteroidales bacterium]
MKKSFLLLVSLLFVGFTYSQTIVEIYQNDFDSYSAGDYLGVVDPDNWEPWGGTPGAADDAMVSDDQANSAPNSFVVSEDGGATDIIWKLGDKTAGEYQVGWYMYVPTGFEGYYNFQKTEAPGTEWAFEIFFLTDGTAEFTIDQTVVATFNYDNDTWFYMDHSINLDDDMAEVFYEGTSIHSWAWSNGGLLQLGGVDFYAAEDVNFYVDDVLYEQVFSPIYCDDFEAYAAGEYIAEENPDFWATWGNAPGTPEDGLISDDQAYAGSNSVLCEGAGGLTDLILKLGDKTGGIYQVDWYMYVPSGAAAYYNFQKTEAPGTEWAFEIYFYDDGTAEFQIDQTVITAFNYSQDTWFYMDHMIDLDDDLAEVYFDGTLLHSWDWSNGGLLQLGGVDFFTSDETYAFYFDDLCYLQTGGSTDPSIAVDPSSFTKTLDAGTSEMDILTIENTGGADLNYHIALVYDVGSKRDAIPVPPLKNTVKNPEFSEVSTLGGGTAPSDDEVTLNWDGENNSAIGLTAPGEWEAGVMFPSNIVWDYPGMDLTSVDVYINDPDPADEFKLRIYEMNNYMMPGDMIYEQDFSPLAMSWNNVELDTPVKMDGQDLWVGVWVNQTTTTHPIGVDAGPAADFGEFIKIGVGWSKLGLDGNWNIRANLTGTPMAPWLAVDPDQNVLMSGESDEVDVTFDATDLTEGGYMADIVVVSNDPASPMTEIPVQMVVIGGGTTSTCIDFESIADFSLTFGDWTTVDVDGLPTYGITGVTFPGSGDPMAYINFNPAETDPPMTDPEIQPHGGDKFGACFASTEAPWNDDWFISPQISLGDNSEFVFWVKSYIPDYGLERYNVHISNTGNDPEDFIKLNSGDYLEAPADAWEEQVWDISDWDQEDVYVAIQCVSQDAFIFMIDDVCVNTTPVGISEPIAENSFVVYPNPANDYVTVEAASAIKQVRVFNYVGQVVEHKVAGASIFNLNTSAYKAGIYFIQVETAEGTSTQKVVIE